MISPGARYGLLKRNNNLYEIGVSFPAGLDRGMPCYGIILQLQFEHLFRIGRTDAERAMFRVRSAVD